MADPFAHALALHRQGRLEEAVAGYERLIDAEPGHAGALYHASLVRGAQGRAEEALAFAVRALAANPSDPNAHAQAGGLLAMLYRHDEALAHLRRALELEPGRADVTNNIGAVLRTLGRLDEARAHFARAVALDPSYRDAVRNLGNALSAEGRYDEATGLLSRLVSGGVESAAVHSELGKSLWKSGRHQEAERALLRALELDPGYADALATLGNMLLEEGRLEEASRALRDAVARAPDRPEFYRHLADADPASIAPGDIEFLEKLAARDLPIADRIDVHFALGTIAAAGSEWRRSLEHFLAGNREKRKLVDYDEAATLKSFQDVAGVFSPGFLQARRDCGNASALPVFIFGMPRSGTTLIEQILAGHPLVHGAGELSAFENAVNDVLGSGAPDGFATDAAALRAIGDRYVETSAALAPPGVTRVTDKMPDNFKYAGLIHIALPNARMIHAVRDPIDTCLSCFCNVFADDGLAWTYDLAELGRRCHGYRRLMDHWRLALPPGAMLEVRYEDVVANLEAEARRIVAYCGLPWDDRVLDFYTTQRRVRTASAAQVRKPIYRTSLGRAKGLDDLIAPLRDTLEDEN